MMFLTMWAQNNSHGTLPHSTLLSLSESLITKTAWLACLGVSSGHWCSKAHLLLPAGPTQHPSSHLLATTQRPLNGMLGSEHIPPLHHRGEPATTLHLRLLFWISNMVTHRARQQQCTAAEEPQWQAYGLRGRSSTQGDQKVLCAWLRNTAEATSKKAQNHRTAVPLQWTPMSTTV